ncbi:MAG TPA: hypothetical protein VNW04_12860 [Puia sp.]|jgi:hypothetical protein|nr:hypothetical protein [Puia sp.]
MEKITYLLGAGASAEVLPLIKKNPSSGKQGLSEELENFVNEEGGSIAKMENLTVEDLKLLKVITKKCRTFGTPDLAAKYYHETKDWENYLHLKKLMSWYFYSFERTPNRTGTGFEGRNLDPRVVPFLTTISSNGRLPKTVKMLSWNYDTQIEMGANFLKGVPGKSNDFDSQFFIWPYSSQPTDTKDREYFLHHLNGYCGPNYSKRSLAGEEPSAFDMHSRDEPLLSFAWEDDDSYDKTTFTTRRIELASKLIVGTTILVVIGYSFPFFNRKIDAKLFETMKWTLQKIYFQDPYLDGQFLYGQFGLNKDSDTTLLEQQNGGKAVDIQWIKDKSQYFVPFEL